MSCVFPVDAATPVGVAKVDITPDYPILMSGYLARHKPSEGIAQKIWAKALAVGNDTDGPAVLVTVDTCGVSDEITEEVAARLNKQTGLPRERFVVCSTHTHSAPMLTGVLPFIFAAPISAEDQATIDRYTRELTDNIEKAALAALADRKPAQLSFAIGNVGFAKNRRKKDGPVDHALPMLVAADPDGKPRAILISYACHCTSLGPTFTRICGDWAGFAQEYIERDHPGSVALVAVGCGADANPERAVGPDISFAQQPGELVSREVARLMKEQLKPINGPITARLERIALPFDKQPTKEEWVQRSQSKLVGTAYHAKAQLERLKQGKTLPTELSYPVQAWNFGDDLAMVFLAGEVVADYSLRLKTIYDPARLWVNGYSNYVPCYIPSKQVLKDGGYEAEGAMVYYDRPTRFSPEVEDLIVNAVQRLVGPQFYAKDKQAEFPPPLSPADSLATIRVKPGLTVDLVAAEPLVVDPVAIDFGPDGKLWAAEMHDYPTGLDKNWQPGGRVRMLEDTDGDGKPDKGTIFLEGIPFPTGIMAWRDGVLVCAAPDILFARDTNGDGKADEKTVLFTGFATENYQARVNGLSMGLDNWVYGANGLLGGEIKSLKTGKSLVINGRDFRMNPDTGEFEPAAGLTQQGRIRDDWGNWFGNTNSHLLLNYPMPDDYARRNPYIPAPSPVVYVNGRGEDVNRLFPISRPLMRFNHPESINRATSACGPTIYRDELLGQGYFGNAFACEPVHNVVVRLQLEPAGCTFTASRAADEQRWEFLASTDNWFRPVQVRTGVDGALWVVDMYRFVIEHPHWITKERLATLDVRAGADRGRIYRVYPKGHSPRKVPTPRSLPTADLVAALDTSNGPMRDLVQRELVQRGDKQAIEPLTQLAHKGEHPAARMQALCALDGLGALTAPALNDALADPHAHVRRQAVRLSERLLRQDAALVESVAQLATDDEITVRYQVALSLGESSDPRAGKALGEIAVRDGADNYVAAAVLSSAIGNLDGILAVVLPEVARDSETSANVGKILGELLRVAVAAKDEAAIARVLAAVGAVDAVKPPEPWQLNALAGLLDLLDRQKTSLDAFHKAATEPLQKSIAGLAPVFAAARHVAVDDKAPEANRLAAMRLLGRGLNQQAEDVAILAGLLEPRHSGGVQAAAVEALGRTGDRRIPEILLGGWNSYGPGLRSATLDVLFQRPQGIATFLDAVEKTQVRAADVDASHRERLLGTKDPATRQRATKLLAGSIDADRQKLVASFQAELPAAGDAKRGEAAFKKTCANCHRYQGTGHEVGPDLATLTDRSAPALLTAILDPNKAVEAKFLNYTAATVDGLVLTGRLVNETGNSVTLLGPESKQQVVLRTDIEALTSSGKSLMPEGLEKELKPADLADLIAYLGSAGPARKIVPGNQPAVAAAGENGLFHLRPAIAEIYGPTLTLESGILVNWRSADDQARWKLDVSRAGRYEVWFDWVCEDSQAGNTAVAQREGDEPAATVTVKGTSANRVNQEKVGEIDLPVGPSTLVVRPDAKLSGKLFDLKAVTLLPIAVKTSSTR